MVDFGPVHYVPISGDYRDIEDDARFYQAMAAACHVVVQALMLRADTAYFAYDSWEYYTKLRAYHAAKARKALQRLLKP